jgi:hypothetical protein
MRSGLVGVALLVGIAGCSDREEIATARLPIGNGQPEPTHEAVVAIGADPGGVPDGFCSGTLITPQLVLSAAHCGDTVTADYVQNDLRVFFGSSIDTATAVIGAEAWPIHPSYQPNPPMSEGRPYDLSVIVLDEAAEITPARWALHASYAEGVENVIAVGFGCTTWGGSEFGDRMWGDLTIDDITDLFLYSATDTNAGEVNICSGDSGGGMFADGRLLAVHSEGLAYVNGKPVITVSDRIDAALPWLLDRVEEVHGTRDVCQLNGWYGDGQCDEGCLEPDDDCATGAGGAGGAMHAGGGGAESTPPRQQAEGDDGGCHLGSRSPTRAWWILLALASVALRRSRRARR